MRIGELYPDLVSTRGKAGEREAYVLSRGESLKFSFDAGTGLLLEIHHVDETPLGPVPSRFEFDDYRTVDGIRAPFNIRWVRADVKLTFRFDEILHNAAVADEKFVAQ